MSDNSHTSIRSRQAAAELHTLREQAGLSGAEVAKRLDMSPSKISRIQNYEALFVPGLLQTAEYARVIIQGVEPTISEAELDNLVAARMARQALLTRARAPQFFAVVDEGALRRPIGEPGVMHRQLQHLLGAAEQPHVTLRVVPLTAGAHAGLRGPFVILEFAEEPALVFMENHSTGLFLEEEVDLAAYRVALQTILQAALAPAATAELIIRIATELG